jgi:hypothetical protein
VRVADARKQLAVAAGDPRTGFGGAGQQQRVVQAAGQLERGKPDRELALADARLQLVADLLPVGVVGVAGRPESRRGLLGVDGDRPLPSSASRSDVLLDDRDRLSLPPSGGWGVFLGF